MKLVTEETESQELQRFIAGKNPWGDSIKLISSTLTKVEVIRASERLGGGLTVLGMTSGWQKPLPPPDSQRLHPGPKAWCPRRNAAPAHTERVVGGRAKSGNLDDVGSAVVDTPGRMCALPERFLDDRHQFFNPGLIRRVLEHPILFEERPNHRSVSNA